MTTTTATRKATEILDAYLAAKAKPYTHANYRELIAARGDIADLIDGGNGLDIFYKGYVFRTTAGNVLPVVSRCLTPDELDAKEAPR